METTKWPKGQYDKKLGVWIPQRILDLDNLSPTEKIILSMIRHYDLKTQADGCFLSNEHIARKVNVKVNTVQCSLNKLARSGYIARSNQRRLNRHLVYLFFIPEEGDAKSGKFDADGQRIIALPKGFHVTKEKPLKEKRHKAKIKAPASPSLSSAANDTPMTAKERVERLRGLVDDARRECGDLFNDDAVASDAELKRLLSSISEQFKDDAPGGADNLNSLSFSQPPREAFFCPENERFTEGVAGVAECHPGHGGGEENRRCHWLINSVVDYDGNAENPEISQGNIDERQYLGTLSPSIIIDERQYFEGKNIDERQYFRGAEDAQNIDERQYLEAGKDGKIHIEIHVDGEENVEKIVFLSAVKLMNINNRIDFSQFFPTVLIKDLKKEEYKKEYKEKKSENVESGFFKPEAQVVKDADDERGLSPSPDGDSSFVNSFSFSFTPHQGIILKDGSNIETNNTDSEKPETLETSPCQQKEVLPCERADDDIEDKHETEPNVPADLLACDYFDDLARVASLFSMTNKEPEIDDGEDEDKDKDECDGKNDASIDIEAVSLPKNARCDKSSASTPKSDKTPKKSAKRVSKLNADEFMTFLPEHFTNPAMIQIVSDYIQMRSDIKKPLTANALKYTLPKFRTVKPEIFAACVLRSIQNSWQGIFLPKIDDHESALSDEIELYEQMREEMKAPETEAERLAREQAEQEKVRKRAEWQAKMQKDIDDNYNNLIRKADQVRREEEMRVAYRNEHHNIRQELIKSSLAEQGIDYDMKKNGTILPIDVPFRFHFTPDCLKVFHKMELFEQVAYERETRVVYREAKKIELSQRQREGATDGIYKLENGDLMLAPAVERQIWDCIVAVGNERKKDSTFKASQPERQNRDYVDYVNDTLMRAKVLIAIPEVCRDVLTLEKIEAHWREASFGADCMFIGTDFKTDASVMQKYVDDLIADHVPGYVPDHVPEEGRQ